MSATIETTPESPANGNRVKILSIIAIVFIAAGIAWFVFWLLVLSVRETTDDAYVNGNKVIVSAQVPGTVVAISADDTQLVEAGQVLVRLDPTDAESALSRAGNALAQAVRQVRQQTAMAGQYDALIASRRLDLVRVRTDLEHREPLLGEQAIAPEELRHAKENVQLAQAALLQAVRQAEAGKALVDGSDIAANPAVEQAKALYMDAWISAKRNAILAPVTGYVAGRNVQLGQRIAPGEALMTVIPLRELWVDANFKEVQLRHLRIGQRATVITDLYGGAVEFHGHIAGMAAGTGAAFSLLPAQNATGNWIKVVQRVPVRIEITPKEQEKYPLRVGLSTSVNVDTHDQSGPVLAAVASNRPIANTDVYSSDLQKAGATADEIVARNLRSLR